MVTLARSVAHLSSEMRSQNVLFAEVEEVKKSVKVSLYHQFKGEKTLLL